MRHAIGRDRLHARISENHFLDARSRGVALIRGTNVGVQNAAELREIVEEPKHDVFTPAVGLLFSEAPHLLLVTHCAVDLLDQNVERRV